MTSEFLCKALEIPPKKSHRSIRILLAEDNLCSQELMLRMLSLMGLIADVANNGREATRAIRSRWRDRDLKIIAVTGSNQNGDCEKCIQAGMDEYNCNT
jgi:CheY-like chemotaxis protein